MSRAFPQRASTAGFSLVEVLVALTLTGLVLSALAMLTGQWLPNWQRGLARVEASEVIALAVDRMAADLAAAEFVPASLTAKGPLFAGTASSVVFVRTALGPNARPGLEIVELSEAGGSGLARRTAPFAPRPADAGLPPFGAPVPLVGASYRVSFSYAGRDGVWRDGWTGAATLPRAVRMVIRDARTGRALDASSAVAIRAELPAACVTDETRRVCAKPRPAGTGPQADEGPEGDAP
ncbi:prepilin-type N-terminal cleavage/methylation domain-containing protein [Xanthobacter autotrophicus]|uniref:PulJ/GspJ family protein n=1 Tax=Xanthobacter TaxID=279 RepID=UPI0024AB84A8|nr:prepilin-type N-terminal cleavage/methylation domain-containing protein [Xanthobacter autotrophicus]MDI4666031.1 prepilin-type N-terminal cleavage/methylation domain-containing protein [Xanthobacter autotrophicus]